MLCTLVIILAFDCVHVYHSMGAWLNFLVKIIYVVLANHLFVPV